MQIWFLFSYFLNHGCIYNLELNSIIISFDCPKNRLCIFPYEWLTYSCRCILNCESVVKKKLHSGKRNMHHSGSADIHLAHFFEYHLWFSAVFQVFLILYQKSHLAHHATDAEHTHTHTHTYTLHVSTSHSPSHPPTHTHTHTHPRRAHAKPAVSSVISSRRGSVTLNSWSMERERKGEKVWGRGRKGGRERAAEGEQGSSIIKSMQLLKE